MFFYLLTQFPSAPGCAYGSGVQSVLSGS